MEKLDVVIIGAGVIGLAIGRAFALKGREVTILESHPEYGMETSSRNSEIIHAGIYYDTNSLKAKLCVSGKAKLYKYCEERDVSHSRIGKLVVAVEEDEIETLKEYQHRAIQNGVTDLSYITEKRILELEPELNAVAGLLSPSTGIVDIHALMSSFIAEIENRGGTLVCNTKVVGGQPGGSGPVINISDGDDYSVQCNLLINSTGLHAPAMAKALGTNTDLVPQAYYAKGHYFELSKKSPFSRLVYPLPNHAGLGIHATLNLANQLRFGPNVQWVNHIDYDFETNQKDEFINAIKRYYPNLDEDSLKPGYTGIRPKVVGPGSTPGDFIIQGEGQHGIRGLINLYGMESPGLTSSMAISDYVVRLAEEAL